jgi:glycosyltransferase involved in cell wall biosynthesis
VKVLVLYDHSGPKYHRVLLPTFLMDVEIVIESKVTNENLKGVDILFFNRAIGRPVGATVQEMADHWRKEYGVKLVVDFDDYWQLGKDHFLFDHYEEHNLHSLMEEWIRASDAVTVTHERLYDKVLPLNKNVHILPNAIPSWGQFILPKEPSEDTRLFWAGSATHKNDLKLLCGPSRRINRKGVKWVMGGYMENDKELQAMASYYTNGGRFNHLLVRSSPVDYYYQAYTMCDIAFIPLVDNTFNSYKSNLKVLEAANVGAPVIVSKVHPYLDFPEDLVNYVEKQSDWFKHADRLLRNPEEAKDQGRKLKEFCMEAYNFERINKKRKEIFESLCEKKTLPNLKVYDTSILQGRVQLVK